MTRIGRVDWILNKYREWDNEGKHFLLYREATPWGHPTLGFKVPFEDGTWKGFYISGPDVNENGDYIDKFFNAIIDGAQDYEGHEIKTIELDSRGEVVLFPPKEVA